MEKGTGAKILETLANAITMDNIQKYILGTKKNGTPRAAYDIFKDYRGETTKRSKKKKKKGRSNLYLLKPKKGKKKNKHWRF